MKQKVYHGILLDVSFTDSNYCLKFKKFNSIELDGWKLLGVEIDRNLIDDAVHEIQQAMRIDQPFYNHFYDDEDMIVIFKEKIFNVKTHVSSWTKIIEYGKALNIPEVQLDFWPNRFQDEIHYFSKR